MKWLVQGQQRGLSELHLSGIILPDAVPKPHLSRELLRWSGAFLRPEVSSGFASC